MIMLPITNVANYQQAYGGPVGEAALPFQGRRTRQRPSARPTATATHSGKSQIAPAAAKSEHGTKVHAGGVHGTDDITRKRFESTGST